ncbi:MAG: extracellular solute-binding protein, partial [Chloroflexi bacterium]|nr:extracellular solute-binding protein [Chloroflexota bacterium]
MFRVELCWRAPAEVEATTIVAYLSVSEDLLARWQDEIEEPFESANPHIDLELSSQPPGGEAGMREKLQVLIAGGVPPDVWEYATMAENDWLIPIDAYVARDQYDLTIFAPKLFDFYTRYDGKLWTIPWGHGGNTFVMALKLQMFAEAGFTVPSTGLEQTCV